MLHELYSALTAEEETESPRVLRSERAYRRRAQGSAGNDEDDEDEDCDDDEDDDDDDDDEDGEEGDYEDYEDDDEDSTHHYSTSSSMTPRIRQGIATNGRSEIDDITAINAPQDSASTYRCHTSSYLTHHTHILFIDTTKNQTLI